MKKTTVLGRLLISCLLCFWVTMACSAQEQTPLDNMDSLTEASHKRMLERQASEREADSLRTIEVTAAVPTQKTEEGRGWYYLLGVFGVVGVVVVFWYFRGKSRTGESL